MGALRGFTQDDALQKCGHLGQARAAAAAAAAAFSAVCVARRAAHINLISCWRGVTCARA